MTIMGARGELENRADQLFKPTQLDFSMKNSEFASPPVVFNQRTLEDVVSARGSLFFFEVLREGLNISTLRHLYEGEYSGTIDYDPQWMRVVFGQKRGYEERDIIQELEELYLSFLNRKLYSPASIKLALHINNSSSGAFRGELPFRNGWYDMKPRTHPAFILNFLRFCLRNGIFDDLEEAVDFLAGPEPSLKMGEVLEPNPKFVLTPEELQELSPGVPLALIHGRFLGIIHPDHELAIQALAQLRTRHPDLLVVVAVDQYELDKFVPSEVFRMSLLAQMEEVDYVLPIHFPEAAFETTDIRSSTRSPVEELTAEEQEKFYLNFYRRIFEGRKGFLYVNPYYPRQVRERFERRCKLLGIEPVGREGGITWSNTLLNGGEGVGLPEKVKSPIEGWGQLSVRGGDPAEALEHYQEYLADHIANTYARTDEFGEWFRVQARFG